MVVIDPKTGLQNSDYLLYVTVLCTKSIEIASDFVTGFSYLIDLDVPWTMNVPVP